MLQQLQEILLFLFMQKVQIPMVEIYTLLLNKILEVVDLQQLKLLHIMPYVGSDLDIGARKLIQVSGSSPATSYTLQSSSVDYHPSAAQNLIVSIAGVIQAPGTAYTVSGATIDFGGVSVASGDIDFIVAMGENVDVGTPSDGVITAGQLSSTFYVENNVTYSSFTMASSRNAVLAGPVSFTGTTTIPSGSTLVIV
jgi:hypothetical protein